MGSHSLQDQVMTLVHQYRIRPHRRMGQHFLVDPAVRDALLAAAAVARDETVLEIGAGFGVLTRALAERARRVIACELDRRLARVLRREVRAHNVQVIAQDVFRLNLPALGLRDRGFSIVSCLPYNITGLVFRTFLTATPRPARLTLMIQREVADRLVARPGSMHVLSVSAQHLATVAKERDVPPEAFWPSPQVDSAIVRLETRRAPPTAEDARFMRLVKIGFASPRKMLRNTLAGGLHLSSQDIAKILESLGVNAAVRAQDLSLEMWKKLFKTLFDTSPDI